MKKLLLIFLMFSMAAFAHAGQVLPNTPYTLLDHPDGNLTNPPLVTYGLRIGDDTWSVEQDGASASMIWDGVGFASMGGTASFNADDTLWNFSYLMFNATASAGGFKSTSGSGVLSNGSTTYFLTGKASGDATARFLPDNHRCGSVDCVGEPMAIIGRGWWDVIKVENELPEVQPLVTLAIEAMKSDEWDLYDRKMVEIYGKCESDGWNKCMKLHGDFLVQAVPVPAALPLLGSALLGFSVFSRRKKADVQS